MIKVAGYGRMSTIDQKLSPKVQEDKVRSWFDYQSKTGRLSKDSRFLGMFIDEGVTSRIDMLMREQGQKILTLLDPGDIVVVASLSRAFRSAADAEKTMAILDEAQIGLVFLDIQVDTSTPTGKVVTSVIAACAKFERDLISQRTKEALDAKRKRGEPSGSPPIGWSIKKQEGSSCFTPDIDTRKVAIAATKLFKEGASRYEVYCTLNKHLRKTRRKPKSPMWFVLASCANLLGFPVASNRRCEQVLGIPCNTIEFIKREDHSSLQATLNMGLRDEQGN